MSHAKRVTSLSAVRLVGDRLTDRSFHYLLHPTDEIRQGRSSCSRLQFLALSNHIVVLRRRPWRRAYLLPLCLVGNNFKMADEPLLLGLPDGNMEENDDKICGWSTNKIGGTPVSNTSS